MFAPQKPNSPARTLPAARKYALAGPWDDACLPSVPVGLSIFRGEGNGLYPQTRRSHSLIFEEEILPKLVAADGDAGGDGEDGAERASRGVLAAAAGDEQDVLALHGHILCLSAQHFLQANRDFFRARRRFAQQARAVQRRIFGGAVG